MSSLENQSGTWNLAQLGGIEGVRRRASEISGLKMILARPQH